MGNANSLKHHLENAQKTGVCSLPKRGLSEVPSELVKVAKNLRTLDLSENKVAVLPNNMQAFPNLKHFNCSNNRLESLPETMGAVTKLDTLLMSYNRIKALPATLGGLKHLKTVNLGHNQLTDLPACLLSLQQLDVLDLSSNHITSLPPDVGQLPCSEINLNENQINYVSEEIAKCPRLRTLRLESNCLSLDDIPVRLLTDSQVSLLALDGNVFEYKQLAELEGYDQYMERYTATKKKMF